MDEVDKNKIEYPSSHPKAKEIREVKDRVNANHRKMNELRDEARQCYKKAGECTQEITECMAKIAEDIEKLEALAQEPLV